jgi:hypothetical protein
MGRSHVEQFAMISVSREVKPSMNKKKQKVMKIMIPAAILSFYRSDSSSFISLLL